MGKDYFSQYKSPNIVIVPSMSFIKESPVKIMSSKKASDHNERVKIEINNSEVKEKNNQQLLIKVSDEKTQNRSWASNYSQTASQPKDNTEKLRSIKRKRGLEETEKNLIQLPKKLKKDCNSGEDNKSNLNVLSKSNRTKVDLTNKKGISNTSSRCKTGVSKVSAKYNDDLCKKYQKEIVQHIEPSKSVKSIVKTTKNFQNIDKKNDLRLRLKRKLENAHNDDKRKKEKIYNLKYRDFSKFKRDHLFVTIRNERNDNSLNQKDNKNAIINNNKNINLLQEKENYTSIKKEKYNDLLIEKNKTKSPKKLKSNKSTKENAIKKIQLIINVTYTKPETSPKTVKGDDKCALATEDLSFLDDFNVDEIVDSLKKCENDEQSEMSSNKYINLFNDQEPKQTNVISNITVGTNKISNSEDIYSEITRKLAAFDAFKTFSSTRIRNDIANILIDEKTIEKQPSGVVTMDGETPLKQYQDKQKDKLPLQKINDVQLDKTSPKENNIAKTSDLNKKLIDLKNDVFLKENKNIQLGKASKTKPRIERKNKGSLKEKNNVFQIDKLSLMENWIKKIDNGSPIKNNIAQLDKFCLKKNQIEQDNKVSAIEKNIVQLDKASTRRNKYLIEEKNEMSPKKNTIVQLDKNSFKKTRSGRNNKTQPKEIKITQLDKASLTRIEQNNQSPPIENNIRKLNEDSLKKNRTEQKNEVLAKEKNIALLDEAPIKKNRIKQKNETPSKEKTTVHLDIGPLKKTRIDRKNETLPKEKRNDQLSLAKIGIAQNNETPPKGNNIAQTDEAPLKKNQIEQKSEAPLKENGTVQTDKVPLKKTVVCQKNETFTKEKRNGQFGKVSLMKIRIEQNNETPPIGNNIAQIDQVYLKKNLNEQKNEVSTKEKHIAQVDEVSLNQNQTEQKNEPPPKENGTVQTDKNFLKINRICGKNVATLNENNNGQLYVSLKEKRIEQKNIVTLIENNIAQTDKTCIDVMEKQIKQKRETPLKENNADQASLKENEIKHNFEDLNKNNVVQIVSLMENQIELKKEDKKSESLIKLDQIEQKKENTLKLNQFKQINKVQLTENLIKKINKVPLDENINDNKKNLVIDMNYTNNTKQEIPKMVEVFEENSTDKNVKTSGVPVKLETLRNNCKPEVQEENKKKLLDSCLDAEETYMIQDIGKRLHQKYSITNIIHRGTFSRILHCNKKSEGKSYIFKVLRRKCDNFLLGLKKYKMLKSVQEGIPANNYNLVSIVERLYILGHWCFVMDYYPQNLGQLLEKVDLDIHQVQTLARQLVAAVTVLRNNCILHSDIKPSHILIDGTNKRLKLCGFDRAMYIQDVVLRKDIGTINYRAPEIIMGYSAGFSVDVWATAVVLYEMATKRQLFPGEHDNDILYKQMCTLGELPWDMIEDSYHGCEHFLGSKFKRVVGYDRKRIIFIPKFYTSNRLKNTLLLEENINWCNIKSDLEKKEILAKHYTFYKLLQQMLVLHPRHRISIEFVYANPFIYKLSNDDYLF